MAKDYRQDALNELDPAFNQRKLALQNLIGSNTVALQGQKTGINSNYDKLVENQNINNSVMKNGFDNQQLSKGFGRSTVTTTGLASMDDKNDRIVGGINSERTSALGNIDSQIAQMTNGTNAQIAQMEADKETEVMALMRQLKQQDFENSLALKKVSGGDGGGGSSPSTKGLKKNADAEYDYLTYNMAPSAVLSFVQGNSDAYLNKNSKNYIGEENYLYLLGKAQKLNQSTKSGGGNRSGKLMDQMESRLGKL